MISNEMFDQIDAEVNRKGQATMRPRLESGRPIPSVSEATADLLVAVACSGNSDDVIKMYDRLEKLMWEARWAVTRRRDFELDNPTEQSQLRTTTANR
jgi:hypothetical protein